MAMRRKKKGAERKKKKEKKRWSGKQQWSKAKAMEPATQNSSRKPCRKKTTQVKQSRQEWEWKPGSSDYCPLRTQTCTLQTVTQLKVKAHRRGKAFSPHCCSYGEGKANYFSGKIKTNNRKPRQLPQLSAEDMRHAQLQKDAKAELRDALLLYLHRKAAALNYHLLFASFFLEGETHVCQTGPGSCGHTCIVFSLVWQDNSVFTVKNSYSLKITLEKLS